RHTRFSRDWSSDVCSSDLTFVGTYGTLIEYTYNGTGLVTPTSLDSEHNATDEFNSFIGTTITGTIDFYLGASYDIEGLSFWNQRSEERRVGKECISMRTEM